MLANPAQCDEAQRRLDEAEEEFERVEADVNAYLRGLDDEKGGA